MIVLTHEQIEGIRDGSIGVTEAMQRALCDLALQALDMQPRPISTDLSKLAESVSASTPFELPDDIRVPLHSLQADVAGLLQRVTSDPDIMPHVIQSLGDRLSQIETACYGQVLRMEQIKAREGHNE